MITFPILEYKLVNIIENICSVNLSEWPCQHLKLIYVGENKSLDLYTQIQY